MKALSILSSTILFLTVWGCSLDSPDLEIEFENFPRRLVMDEEGSALADESDYAIKIEFADDPNSLPMQNIVLTYALEGEDDFSGVTIAEVIYEYEDDDCVFIREVAFTSSTITLSMDEDMGSLPGEIEVVFDFNLPLDEASAGGFTFEITSINSAEGVLFNQANTFEYEILENDFAGEWEIEFTDEAAFDRFKDIWGIIANDVSDLSFAEIGGSVVFEFGFEEMKAEIELNETEEITACENGEIEVSEENLVVEIEADYEAEDGEFTLEGSLFNEDDEELDFIISGSYEIGSDGNVILTITQIISEDNFESGDELFAGTETFILVKK